MHSTYKDDAAQEEAGQSSRMSRIETRVGQLEAKFGVEVEPRVVVIAGRRHFASMTVCGCTKYPGPIVSDDDAGLPLEASERARLRLSENEGLRAEDVDSTADAEAALSSTWALPIPKMGSEGWPDRWINTIAGMPSDFELFPHGGRYPCFYLKDCDIRHGRPYFYFYGKWRAKSLCCPFPYFLGQMGISEERIKLLCDCFEAPDIGITNKAELHAFNAEELSSHVFSRLAEKHFPQDVQARLIAQMQEVGWICSE